MLLVRVRKSKKIMVHFKLNFIQKHLKLQLLVIAHSYNRLLNSMTRYYSSLSARTYSIK